MKSSCVLGLALCGLLFWTQSMTTHLAPSRTVASFSATSAWIDTLKNSSLAQEPVERAGSLKLSSKILPQSRLPGARLSSSLSFTRHRNAPDQKNAVHDIPVLNRAQRVYLYSSGLPLAIEPISSFQLIGKLIGKKD